MAAACEKKSGTFAVSLVLALKPALLQRARARGGSWLLGVKAHAPGGACTQTSSLLPPLSPLFGSGFGFGFGLGVRVRVWGSG